MVARSISFLNNTLFADPQTAAAITPTRMRDLADTMAARTPVIRVTDPEFGGDSTGTTDCTSAYNAAHAAVVSSGTHGVIEFPPGKYKFWQVGGITLNPWFASIRGDGAVFDFTGAPNATTTIADSNTGQIITNGNFASGSTGWTTTFGTPSFAGNQCTFTNQFVQIGRTISVLAGFTYTLSVNYTLPAGGFLGIGFDLGGIGQNTAASIFPTPGTSGTATVTYKPGSSGNIFISIGGSPSTGTMIISNVLLSGFTGNIVQNSDFSSNAANWTTGVGASGFTFPGNVSFTGAAGTTFGQMGQLIPITPGQMWELKITYNAAPGGNIVPGLFINGIGSGAVWSGPTLTGSGTFTTTISPANYSSAWLVLAFTAPAGTTGSATLVHVSPYQTVFGVNINETSAGENYGNATQSISGIEIIGPGRNSGFIALNFNTTVNNGIFASRLATRDCTIHECGAGLFFQNNAYVMGFFSVDIWDCGIACILYPTGVTDSGEAIRLFSCNMFNSNIGIDNTGGSDFFLFGCSIDYNTFQLTNNHGNIESVACHWEMNVPGAAAASQRLFNNYGNGFFHVIGGAVVLTTGSTGADYIFWNNDATSMTILDGCGGQNWNTTTGYVAGGNGKFLSHGHVIHGPQKMISPAANMDLLGGAGSFEGATLNLIACVLGGTQTDRLHAANCSAALSTSFAHGGSQSFKFTKTSAASSQARLRFFIPVAPDKTIYNQVFWLQPTNIGSGNVTMNQTFYWVNVIDRDSNGLPVVGIQTQIASGDQTVALGGNASWTQSNVSTNLSTTDGYTPPWATHLMIEYNLDALPAGSVYFDDLLTNAI